MAANGEGVYSTRPWKVYGEKPETAPGGPTDAKDTEKSKFNEGKYKYTAGDIRFTASKDGKTVYAFCLGAPSGEVRIKSLAGEKIAVITLLGSDTKPEWKQESGALVIKPVAKWPSEEAVGFKISLN